MAIAVLRFRHRLKIQTVDQTEAVRLGVPLYSAKRRQGGKRHARPDRAVWARWRDSFVLPGEGVPTFATDFSNPTVDQAQAMVLVTLPWALCAYLRAG